jgi:iron complex transport system substrate-binding protein
VALVVVASMAATPALAAAPREAGAVAGASPAQVAETQVNGCTFPFTETDATGTEVTVETAPERVVTLGASEQQTVWEIGDARETVVGGSPFADYLTGSEAVPSVYSVEETRFFTGLVPNATLVERQDPDLVLAANTIDTATVEDLRESGITVYKFDTATDVEFVYRKTRLTGRLVGECDAADERTAELRDQVETIRRATSGVEDRKRVFYVGADGFTVGENTFIHEIITVAGAENVGAEYGSGFYPYTGSLLPVFGREDITSRVVASNPDWLVRTSPVEPSSAFRVTTAGRQNQTVVLNSDYTSQPAPRIVVAMATLVANLYPERYRKAQLGILREEARQNETWEVPYADADPRYTTVEGGEAVLRVQNGEPPTTRWAVPDRFAPNSSVRLTDLAVTTREPNPIFSVRVRDATGEGPPLPGNATRLAAYDPTAEDLIGQPTGAEVTVRVPLESVGAPAERLTVYRRSGDGWTTLNTTVSVDETNQTATVTASADGLPAFAVGVAPAEPAATSTPASTATPAQVEPTATPTAAPTASPTATPTATASPTATPAPTPTPTTGGGPGFGPVAAVAALAATALLLRRR